MVGVRRSLAIAATAAVVASAGDLLLLWVAAATRPALELPGAPAWALVVGHFAGVLAIPFYGLGWMALARPLATSRPRAAIVVRGAGTYAAALGTAIHGITGTVLAAEQSVAAAGIDPYAMVGRWAPLLLPLWGLATSLIVLASWVWSRAAWRGQAGVPPSTAWTNPGVGTVVLAAVGATTPLARALLLPAAPNLAHVVFFVATAISLRR
jgi:hypothetical protein